MSEMPHFSGGLRLGPIRLSGSVLGLTAVLVIFLAVGGWAASSPTFCRTCHEMRPEYYTWMASDHSLVSCGGCHTPAGLPAAIAHKKQVAREVIKHVSGAYYLPIELSEPVPDDNCLRCHAAEWERLGSGDVKAPHLTHKARGVACVECHNGVAHGRLAERQVTIDGAFVTWNDAKGRSNVVRPFRSISMKQCMECHSAREAANDCETCHKKLIRPESHMAADFQTTHGKSAREDISYCDRCHSFTLSMVHAPAPNPVAEYTRNNTFCSACHKTRPEGHTVTWVSSHGGRARQVGLDGCQVCHESNPPRKAQGIAKTYCNQCHKAGHGVPKSHPVPIPPGPPGESCTRCHSARVCSKCHTNLAPAPSQQEARPPVGS